MAETIGSMLPLALLLGLAWLLFSWLRRRARNAPPAPALRGPNGWLALFIFGSYFLAPLFTLGSLANELNSAERQYPNLLSMAAWGNYKLGNWLLFGAIVVWQWWVAHSLQNKFVPSSVTLAKTFLLGSPVVLAVGVAIVAYTTLNYAATEEALTVLIKSIFGGLAWFLYFTFSKRVKNTYLMGVDTARASPRIHVSDAAAERADPTFTEPAALVPVSSATAPASKPTQVAAEPQLWADTAACDTAPVLEAKPENSAYSNALTVQLDALKRMHERGALTDDEYGRKRQELLARI